MPWITRPRETGAGEPLRKTEVREDAPHHGRALDRRDEVEATAARVTPPPGGSHGGPLASRTTTAAGLVVDTQTLWDQLHALSAHLEPTYEALWGEVLGSQVVMADETQWPLLDKPGSTRCFAWSAASGILTMGPGVCG